jgi:pyruvate dehydrogenase E2 component (dihydrolipoamide acetyltransferase)
MALVDVKVPDIGDFESVDVIELLVKPGDTVKAEQSLVTVESDKASMEIPSSHTGVVKAMKVALGDKVAEGSVLLSLETAESAAVVTPSVAVGAAPATSVPEPGSTPAATHPPLAASAAASATVAAEVTAAKTATASSGPIEILVPDIGDFDEVAVIEVLIKVGDVIKVEQSLITVESDKASMEIPSSHAGTVKELRVQLGDKVHQGSVVAVIEPAGAVASAVLSASAAPAPTSQAAVAVAAVPAVASNAFAPASSPTDRTTATVAATVSVAAGPATSASASAANKPPSPMPQHEPTAPQVAWPHASPTIRRLARELGVPLAEVPGSGPKGRITALDVQSFVKQVMAGSATTQAAAKAASARVSSAPAAAGGAMPGLLAWPQVDFAKFGPIERRDLSRIKKISGANLHRNWVLIPHVTNHDDADITELEAFRMQLNRENEKTGVKVTMLAFLIKACASALKAFPDFNASLDGDQLVVKQYTHIGFAADTPNGLMVPVVRDADRKGILQISAEMSELAKKARDGKLSPAEMTGGCFSISSLGGIGGRYFTPIINAPEVAILGVCRSRTEPVWDGSAFAPRLMLPLSLSWDHRVIDGAAAARFNAFLVQVLGDFRRVLL